MSLVSDKDEGQIHFIIFTMVSYVSTLPHGAESHLIGQVCVMWQQGREEVLGEGVHGNALPVDDLTQAAERTSWTKRKTK